MAKYKYPYSDFHELNLDYILRLCRESLGIGLKVMDKQLWLVNDLDEPLSKVTISYATAAKYSDGGNDIDTFLISAGTDNDALVFTNGKGEATVINVPKAQKAVTDVNGKELAVNKTARNHHHNSNTYANTSTSIISLHHTDTSSLANSFTAVRLISPIILIRS